MPSLSALDRMTTAPIYTPADSNFSSIHVPGITSSTPISQGGFFPEFCPGIAPSPVVSDTKSPSSSPQHRRPEKQPSSKPQKMPPSSSPQHRQPEKQPSSKPQKKPPSSSPQHKAKTHLQPAKRQQNVKAKKLMFRNRQQKCKDRPPLDSMDLDAYTPKTTQKASKMWIQNGLFTLTEEDKSILYSQTETAWLTDTIINAAQKLLSQKVPLRNGFQDVCCGRTYAFNVEASEFSQVLHNGHGHWITITTIGAQEGEVLVYDSLYPSVSSCVKRQIAALLATDHDKITLKHMDVQMQSGTYDCGLFAIAFATTLVHGELPGRFLFDQDSMRRHLVRCLELGEMTMFPVKKTRRSAGRIKSEDIIEIHCSCRMPEIPEVDMIECSGCSRWFHFPLCVSVPQEARNRGSPWYCTSCT